MSTPRLTLIACVRLKFLREVWDSSGPPHGETCPEFLLELHARAGSLALPPHALRPQRELIRSRAVQLVHAKRYFFQPGRRSSFVPYGLPCRYRWMTLLRHLLRAGYRRQGSPAPSPRRELHASARDVKHMTESPELNVGDTEHNTVKRFTPDCLLASVRITFRHRPFVAAA